MKPKLIEEISIPAEHGKAFKVYWGQTLRVITAEGPQVADIAFFNAHDYSDTYDAPYSYMSNVRMGTGTSFGIRFLYSRLPTANLMAEVMDDKVGKHWVINSGHCNWFTNKLRGLPDSARNCWGNIAEAISDFGLTPEKVQNRFPAFLNFQVNKDGTAEPLSSLAKKGDYIDFLAHMHLLVAVSACPGKENNAGKNKSIKVEIWEPSPEWD